MDIVRINKLGIVASTCLLLAACGGGSGDSGGSNDTGKLSLSITDTPIYQAQRVEVDFTGVQVKPESGDALQFSFCKDPTDPDNNPPIVEQGGCSASDPAEVTIDLLKQTGGASFLLLDEVEMPAGRVNWVRLMVTDPAGRIELSSGLHDLTVSSGNQTGLKLNRGFTVPAGGEVVVYIDFNVRKSVVEAAGKYKLKPSLRLVQEYGAITGEVDPALLPATCLGPSVYVFAGAAATPDDIDGDDGDPVGSANVEANAASSTGFSYRADFLAPGDYTVAFVCADGVSPDGGATFSEPADEPDRDDTLSFTLATPTSSATVADGQSVDIDF
jgi:hypothetical protein